MRPQRQLAIATRFMAPLLGAGMLLASAGLVAADEPPVLNLDPAFCALYNDDGEIFDSVPAGSQVLIFEGWITKTRGQLQGFMNNVTWVLTVNGQAVDLAPYLSGAVQLGGSGRWGDFFAYSTGVLSSGTLTTHYDNILKAAHYDGYAHYPRGSVYPIGEVNRGGVDCSFPIT